MTKQKKRELKKRQEAKEKWLKLLSKQHCKEWGFFTEESIPCWIVGVTKQCTKCFTVTEGPTECIDCIPEFASREERLARNCPLYNKKK